MKMLAIDARPLAVGGPAARHKQVDALIHYPDFEAALEVVADHDAKFNRQEDALKRIEDHIQASGLRDSSTAVISRIANIKMVKVALPALLLALQDNPVPRRSHSRYRTLDLDRVGVKSAWRRTSPAPGPLYLIPESWWGFGGTQHTVGDWVTDSLTSRLMYPRSLPHIRASRSDTRSSGPHTYQRRGGAGAASAR
jgi:hypothetical protein